MEAFSLLKFWRGGGGCAAAAAASALSTTDNNSNAAAAATTAAILTAVAQTDVEIDDDDDSDNDDDDGPFFDLEFTLLDDSEDSPQNLNEDHTASDSENHSEQETEGNMNDNNINEDSDVDNDDEDEESEREIKFKLSPSSSDRNLSDDVVFKGELVQLEPSSFVLNPSEPNSKPQFTASLLKSATKFRVFMLGLKKPKPNNNSTSEKEKDPNGSDPAAPNPKQQRKLFTVKFKVEEVPIMSLFTRDNSSKGAKASSAASTNNKDLTEVETQRQSQTKIQTKIQTHAQSISSASEEKRLMQKYLRKVKPLYVKVSRRYAEKLRFSGQLNMSNSVVAEKPATEGKEGDAVASEAVEKGQKQGNLALPAGLRVVCKHLGKSRSASSVAVPAAAPAQAPTGLDSSKRRDDSLLQQQDGIQGAILHCKRSFNASREFESSSQLPRCVSDPLHEVSPELSRKSSTEGK